MALDIVIGVVLQVDSLWPLDGKSFDLQERFMGKTLPPVVVSILVASILVGHAITPAHAQEAVTSCGQLVQSTDAILTADLDCSASVDAIEFTKGSRFDLGGFTLTGSLNGNAIQSSARCNVFRGTIVNGDIFSERAINASDLTMTGGDLFAFKRISATNVDISDGGINSTEGSVKLIRSSVTGAPIAGVMALDGAVKLIDSEVTLSGGIGVIAWKRVIARGSTISGNCTEGPTDCFDLKPCEAPSLDEDSSCGTSAKCQPAGETWGVCSAD